VLLLIKNMCTGLGVVEVVRGVALHDVGYIEWHMCYTVYCSCVKEIVYFFCLLFLYQ
jgi:hypothetical protein